MTNLTDEIRRQDLGYATLQYRGLWAERLELKPHYHVVWLDREDGSEPVDLLNVKSWGKVRHSLNHFDVPYHAGAWLRSSDGWFLSWIVIHNEFIKTVKNCIECCYHDSWFMSPDLCKDEFSFPFETFRQLDIVPA